jgi:hypothetical protein
MHDVREPLQPSFLDLGLCFKPVERPFASQFFSRALKRITAADTALAFTATVIRLELPCTVGQAAAFSTFGPCILASMAIVATSRSLRRFPVPSAWVQLALEGTPCFNYVDCQRPSSWYHYKRRTGVAQLPMFQGVKPG